MKVRSSYLLILVAFFTLGASGCPRDLTNNELAIVHDADEMKAVQEVPVEEEGRPVVDEAEKQGHLFLKDVSDDYSPDFYVNFYREGGNLEVLTTVHSVRFGVAKAQLAGSDLYYLNDKGGVSFVNLETLKHTIIPIPRVDPSDFTRQVNDFEFAGDTIFYLLGGCSESYACEIHQFDLETKTNERVYDGLRASPVGGFDLLEYDEDSRRLLISDGWGDAGHLYYSVNQLDLDTGEYSLLEEYNARYCGDENEYCDDEQLLANKDYDDYFEAQFPDSVTCHGVEMPIKEGEVFVGCYN